MGDRTTVTLTVLSVHAEAAQALFEYSADEGPFEEGDAYTSWHFNEVNYGELDFLDVLRKAGIAYDSDWDSGSGFEAGSTYLRFTEEGDASTKTLSTSDFAINTEALIATLDYPEKLRNLILHHKEYITVLPWDNQEQYGKLYQVNRIINLTV